MPRPTLAKLSATHHRILSTLLSRENAGEPNFISDLLAALHLKAESSLTPTLHRMTRLGVILLQGGGTKGRQRLVVPTDKGRLLHESTPHSNPVRSVRSPRRLPLLGAIPAGPLAEVIARDDAENVSVDGLLDARPGDFLLRIKGDSMTGDGILNEDLVLIRPSDPVRQGEIAAVIATGAGSDWDATLKHLHWLDRGRPVPPDRATEVRLRASNPAYPDILLPPEGVRVAGVFRGLIRQGNQGRLNPHASSS